MKYSIIRIIPVTVTLTLLGCGVSAPIDSGGMDWSTDDTSPDVAVGSDIVGDTTTGEQSVGDTSMETASPWVDSAGGDTAPMDTDTAPMDTATAPMDTDTAPMDTATAPMDTDTAPSDVCQSNSDCSSTFFGTDLICGGRRVNGSGMFETYCKAPNIGGDSLGASCTSDATCAENACINDQCSRYCTSDADCTANYTGSGTPICTNTQYTPGPVTVGFCAFSCGDNADCTGAGQVCSMQLANQDTSWTVDKICMPQIGAGLNGDSCASGSDCASGLCLSVVSTTVCSDDTGCTDPTYPTCIPYGTESRCAQKACSNLCDASDDTVLNEDCTTGATGSQLNTCANAVMVGLPDGTSQVIESCTM